jgi:hypothetical protein
MQPAFVQVEAGLPQADFSGPVIPSAVDAPAFHFECGEAQQNLKKHIGSFHLPLNRLSRPISLSLNHTELSPSLGLRSATFYKLLTR